MAAAETLLLARKVGLLTRRIELRVARQIGLRIAGAEGWLVARPGLTGRLVVAVVANVVAYVVATVHGTFAAEERRRLTELFLCGCDQAEIVLGMLEIILGR